MATFFIDGACAGNPGPMRIAVVGPGIRIVRDAGTGTNNRAEYLALLSALSYARALCTGTDEIVIKSDSQLLVRQMNGIYKVRSHTLKPLYEEAQKLLHQISTHCKVSIQWVPREWNLAGKMLEAES